MHCIYQKFQFQFYHRKCETATDRNGTLSGMYLDHIEIVFIYSIQEYITSEVELTL